MVDEIKEGNKKPSWFKRLASKLSGEPQDRDDLMDVLRDAEEHEILSADNLSMIESVLQVSEMQVREVMIPKTQMVVIDSDCSFENILPLVIESGHSRFPIIENHDVIGILLAKDLLKYCYKQSYSDFNIKDILRSAVFVPQSKRLDVLLKEFRVNRNHIAIVIDEYGQVAGLVTIEDVLEQIVGEIEDEYDIDEVDYIKKLDDNTYSLKAATPIEDFNEYFSTDFSSDQFDTIGGLILKGFAHLPKRGESIKIENFKFKVLHSDNRRIYLLEVKKEKS